MDKWLIFFLSACILTSCNSDHKDEWQRLLDSDLKTRTQFAEDYKKSHQSFYQGSNWSLHMLDTLIMVHPEGEWPYRTKSIPFTKRGDYHLAAPLLEESMKRDSSESLYYTSWLTLFHYRDYEKALELLQAYDNMTPNVRDYAWGQNVNYLKGLAFRQLQRFEEAIAEFDRGILEEAKVASVYMYIYRGICRFHLRDFDLALQDFESALKKNERLGMAIYYKALCYKRMDYNDKARDWLEKAALEVAKGNKQDHPYFEVFDEVHTMMIQDSLMHWK